MKILTVTLLILFVFSAREIHLPVARNRRANFPGSAPQADIPQPLFGAALSRKLLRSGGAHRTTIEQL